jgi:hypothetical protein
MKIVAATTFGAKSYAAYASKVIDTFVEHWPKDVSLKVYYDEVPAGGWRTKAPNVEYISLDMPDLEAFKRRNRSQALQSSANFLLDAVRFSHKVFAYVDAALLPGVDVAVWLDGDVITHTRVTHETILRWLNGKMAGALLRPWMYTETGFHIFDMQYPEARRFMEVWRHQYTTDKVWNLPLPDKNNKFLGLTDCHTYDEVRTGFPSSLWYNLSPRGMKISHPFVNGILGAHMDHCKGDRKKEGHSRAKDLKIRRNEKYWRDNK